MLGNKNNQNKISWTFFKDMVIQVIKNNAIIIILIRLKINVIWKMVEILSNSEA